MDVQQQAARQLLDALAHRKGNAMMASGVHGYRVAIQGHPPAEVHFGYDNFRGLDLKITVDGKRVAVPPDYFPSPAGTEALADYVVDLISRSGSDSSGG